MNLSKKIPLAMFLASAFAVYSNTARAEHGALGFGIGTASPIITQTGVTLPVGMWVGGVTTQFTRFDSPSDAQLHDMSKASGGHVHSVNSRFTPAAFAAYGVTDNLTLGIRLPYVQRFGVRDADHHGGHHSVSNQGSPGGFGGASLFGQYRFFQTADNLNHLSLIVALTTPGVTNVQTNQGGPFATHLQPSSGAWNPAVGFSYTRAMGKVSFDSNILYTVATSGARKTDIGDSFDYNFALSYAFVGLARNNLFVGSNNSPWTGILELNGTWIDREKVAGRAANPNSGGNIVYISPGIRYSGGKSWNTALSIGTPIVNDISVAQTPADYRITWRFVVAF